MIVTAGNILQIEARIHASLFKAADTETYGLGFEATLFSIIVAAGGEAFYFNFKDYLNEGVTGLSLSDGLVRKSLERIFSRISDTWFMHNAKFDLHKLRRFGVEVPGIIWDTKVHARILKNNLLNYSLAALTKGQKYEKSKEVDEYIAENKLTSKRTVEGKKKLITDRHFDQVNFSTISGYGLKDALCTEELGLSQMKQYETRPTLWALRDNELKLTKVIFEMESTGIQIDPDYVLAGWKEENSIILDAESSFLAATGLHLKDTKKLALVQILKDAGEIISISDKGNPVLDSDALALMTSPVAQIIQKIRYHEKRITAFYSTFMQYRDCYNLIHANMDQAGTETGRFSMSTPNLQQLSKDGDETDIYPIRGCFKPRTGKVFVQFDYSQQEYRLLADYANEKGLLEKIAAGFDVHKATAELVGVTRDEAKTLNFSILYGAGAAKVAAALKISVSAARKLIDRYFAAMPMVENFITKVKGSGAARGYVFNWMGRVCNIARRDWSYVLPNHLIQGSGADVTKLAIVKIAEYLKERQAISCMVLTVHDSIVLEMLPEEFYLLDQIKNIMESVYISRNGVTLKTDMEWSNKSLSKRDLIKGDPRVQRVP